MPVATTQATSGCRKPPARRPDVPPQVPQSRRDPRSTRQLGKSIPRYRPARRHRQERRGPRHSAADHRPRSRPGAPGRLGRRQHARHARSAARASRSRSPRTCSPSTPAPTRPAASRFPRHMAETLRDSLFYVVPRISPDGAEEVLKRGRYVRSSPVDDRVHKGHALLGIRGHRRRRHRGHTCASATRRRAGRAARRDGHPLTPASWCRAAPEDPGALLQALSRRDDRQLRRPPHPRIRTSSPTTSTTSTATSPTRGRRSTSRKAPGDYPGSAPETRAVMDFATRAPEHLRVAQPAHLRRRADPPAGRQARRQDGPGRPRDLPPGRGVDDASSPATPR